MQIRDNVRRRRRERIMQLIGEQQSAKEQGADFPPAYGTIPSSTDTPPDSYRSASVDPFSGSEPDPEKWWKEEQKRQRKSGPAWPGMSRLTETPGTTRPLAARTGLRPPAGQRNYTAQFARGFMLRLITAAVLFGAAWGWFRSELPGSREAKAWMTSAVTEDMDFQAIEAWYSQTFGDSPSFLPIFRSRGESLAAAGGWKRNDAVLPVEGRVVQTFAQDGSGVRMAAPGGSDVKAVYAGRVLEVALEQKGRVTVLIQHAGKIVTLYGNLDHPAVKPNDWVEAGQRLGSIPPPLDAGAESLLYFAVKQNGQSLDPAEVVPFD